nr:hypothetical protein K08G2.2 - Caenorhabditis elegans [Caenorhabditis elegans]
MCSTSLGFFASDEVYSKLFHVLTIIEVFIHSFGAYIIISKTPKKLEAVKAGILLTMPVLFLPVCGGRPLGILSCFGVPVSVQTYVGISILGVIIATILIFLKTVDTDWFTKNQCIPTNFFDHPKFFLLDLTGNYIVICIVGMLSLLIFQMFVQIALIFRQLLKHTPISRNTQRLQKQYFVAMSLQFVIPVVIIAFPVAYIVLSICLGYHNQGVSIQILLTFRNIARFQVQIIWRF